MGAVDTVYKKLIYNIQQNGFTYQDVRRSEVTRTQVKSAVFELSMGDGLPLLTLKAMPFKMIVKELLWFLRGETNIVNLVKAKVHIWDQDAYNMYLKQYSLNDWQHDKLTLEEFIDAIKNDKNSLLITGVTRYKLGDLGPVYGKQWRDFNGVDQVFEFIKNLRLKPMDTRHIVTAWNPGELHKVALPPCHRDFEALVAPTPKFKQEEEGLPEYNFSLKWTQRSVDTFLGLPFNIASYGVLGIIIQYLTGIHFNSLIANLSNVHIYSNHEEAIKKMEGLYPDTFPSPEMSFSPNAIELFTKFQSIPAEELVPADLNAVIDNLIADDFILNHYQSFERIQADMVAPDSI